MPETHLNASDRLGYEVELRRLRHELDVRDVALSTLAARLQEAEREAHTATSKITEAMQAELMSWQDRCHQAEAELAALRQTAVERIAQPVREVFQLGRKAPLAARKLAKRLDSPTT